MDSPHDRLITIIDEAFGMQPVMATTEEALDFLEARLFRDRQSAEAARDEVERLKAILSLFGLNVDAPADDIARAAAMLVEDQADANERRIDALMKIQKLEERQQSHLETIRRITQTTPLDSEVAAALEQRGALLVEVGTLRAKVTEQEHAIGVWFDSFAAMQVERDAALAEVERYKQGYEHEQHVAGEYQRMYAEACNERDSAEAQVAELIDAARGAK